jgi:serine/threonine protein kinase
VDELTDPSGRYRIVRALGKGGMAEVYLAHDTALVDRPVAIKLLQAGLDSEEARERFSREVRSVARLRHQNIVTIHEAGVLAGRPYIAMEYVPGDTLADLVRKRPPLTVTRKLRIIEDLCRGLAFAHRAGIVHGDIKPANVIIDSEGVVKILDFGIARKGEDDAQQGTLAGTPNYMSPEHIRSGRSDVRSDIFAVGLVFYELLTYKPAFSGDAVGVLSQILNEEPEPIESILPGVGDDVVAILRRAIRKDPALRYQEIGEMQSDLSRARKGLYQALGSDEETDEWPPVAEPPPTTVSPPPQPEDPIYASPGTVIGPVLAPAPPTEVLRAPVGMTPPPSTPTLDTEIYDLGLPAGTRVGKYTVHELIARGRTGHLYKAFDPVRSKLVGLKVIRNPSGVTVRRLLRASQIWVDHRHPNLQRILEVDPEQGGVALIATELIEGVDLATLLQSRQLDLAQEIEIAVQVCAALEYLHDAGIVHREISPKNIVVSGASLQVKVLDSGLARSSNPLEATITQVGMIVGDLRYMAPEQGAGRHDQRSDIYSLGVVTYEMVLEEAFEPMAGEVLEDRLAKAGSVPSSLAVTLATALSIDPAHRFQSVREMADALRALVPEKPAPLKVADIVVTLHGIRTHAHWQRAFAEVASRAGLHCRLDRWNFGYFTILGFLVPWSRQAKVNWFRITYHEEFPEQAMSSVLSERPSIVAHSFGTYILGNALMRYPFIRFNKVLLCGSILPADFPWDVLIDRGQVQAVRNEHGARDTWANLVQRFVPGTGPSGLDGFSVTHDRLEQERFDYSHSEYFERGHMESRWVPFIKRRVRHITPRERPVITPRAVAPVGLYALYAIIALVIMSIVRLVVG